MPSTVQLVFTGFVGFYAMYFVVINPWRTSKYRVRSPVAVAAWWLWIVTLLAILASVWIPPVGNGFERMLAAIATRLFR